MWHIGSIADLECLFCGLACLMCALNVLYVAYWLDSGSTPTSQKCAAVPRRSRI